MRPDHRHRSSAPGHRYRRRLAVVLAAMCALLAIEVGGALVSGSLVLLAEAGRMATDAVGIGLLLLLVWLVARPVTPEQTFSSDRLQLLAACLSVALLFGVGAYVAVEAVRRLLHPTEVASGILLVFGTVALVGNACWLWLLRAGQVERRSVDAGARELAIDLSGTAVVLVTAGVIWLTGFQRADPIAAVPIGLLIVCRTWTLLCRAVDVLLEVSPKAINLAEVRRQILSQLEVVADQRVVAPIAKRDDLPVQRRSVGAAGLEALAQVRLERIELAGAVALPLAVDQLLPALRAGVALHGVEPPAQLPGNRPLAVALSQQVMHQLVVTTSAFGEPADGLSRSGGRLGLGWLGSGAAGRKQPR